MEKEEKKKKREKKKKVRNEKRIKGLNGSWNKALVAARKSNEP